MESNDRKNIRAYGIGNTGAICNEACLTKIQKGKKREFAFSGKGGSVQVIGKRVELEGLRKDREVPIEVFVSSSKDGVKQSLPPK